MTGLIDFSGCEDGMRSYGGSDSKASIEYEGRKYMIKFPMHKEAKIEIATSSVNNVLSEYIGSHIMQSLGIEAHNTLLGTYNGQMCIACEDFCSDNERLREFSWYMKNMYTKDQIGRIPSYHQIYDVMQNHPQLSPISEEALTRYWDTFVGDALIGNFDRHKDNWGYIVNEKDRSIRLAPVYDCGSCLYPNVSEDGMRHILSSPDEIQKRIYEFPKAALNRNDNPKKIDKFGYLEMLGSGKDRYCTDSLMKIYRKIDLDKINGIIENVPMISDERIRFYESFVRYRKELIIDRAVLENVKSLSDLPMDKRIEAARLKSVVEKTENEVNISAGPEKGKGERLEDR